MIIAGRRKWYWLILSDLAVGFAGIIDVGHALLLRSTDDLGHDEFGGRGVFVERGEGRDANEAQCSCVRQKLGAVSLWLFTCPALLVWSTLHM